jgi:betaine lipid synthase
MIPLSLLVAAAQMFGEGKHPGIDRLFETRLAPFLSQKAFNFWSMRLWYFKEGLYYQGGMVSNLRGLQ